MRYCIEHLTDYRYTHVAVSTQQTLRLSPRTEAHQQVAQLEDPRARDAVGRRTTRTAT